MFLGACEKSDILLYLSKILAAAEKKILLVDATLEQKYFLSYPVADQEDVLTELNGFDIVRGCKSFDELKKVFKKKSEDLDSYDFVIIDTNDPENVRSWGEVSNHFLVTNFERYTIEKNVQLLESYITDRSIEPIKFDLIVHPYVDCMLDTDYLKSTVSHLPISWYDEEPILFPLHEFDYEIRVNNQHDNRLRFKRLTRPSRRSLMRVGMIIAGLNPTAVRRAFRRAGRG
jgi:hypothetical protein